MESNVGLSRAPLHGSGKGIRHRLGQRHYPWEGETPVKEIGASKPPQLEAAMESNAGLSRAIISWRGREWRNRISAWVSAPPLALVTTISWTWSIGTAILWLEPIPLKSPALLIPPRFYQEEKGGEGGENQSPFHLEGTTRAGSRRKETEEERRTSEWPSSLSPFRSVCRIMTKMISHDRGSHTRSPLAFLNQSEAWHCCYRLQKGRNKGLPKITPWGLTQA